MIEALASFVVGIAVGRVWQIIRHHKQEVALGRHLRLLSKLSTCEERVSKCLTIIADTLEGKT